MLLIKPRVNNSKHLNKILKRYGFRVIEVNSLSNLDPFTPFNYLTLSLAIENLALLNYKVNGWISCGLNLMISNGDSIKSYETNLKLMTINLVFEKTIKFPLGCVFCQNNLCQSTMISGKLCCWCSDKRTKQKQNEIFLDGKGIINCIDYGIECPKDLGYCFSCKKTDLTTNDIYQKLKSAIKN